jgi:4-hydroxy-tetrahydrodipicolinate synthase
MVTPFDADMRIDWDQTARLIDYLIEQQGSDSIVVSGTTGESATLSDEEKLQLFEFAVKHAKGRCRVLAGTGSNSTAHSIHLSRQAERLGVDGLLLVSPYYNRPSQEGLYQHFAAIAKSTDLPVMLYNVPKRTGVHISAETTIRLAELPNVFATKEASGDLESITRIISGTPDDFLVYSGDDSLTLPILSVGGYGVVSVVSHVVGRALKQMIEAFDKGNHAEAARIHGRLMPIFTGLFSAPSPAPVKYALSLHGLDVGGLRLPLIPLNEQEREFIRSLFPELRS